MDKLASLTDKIFNVLTVIAALACSIPAVYSVFLVFQSYYTKHGHIDFFVVISTSFMLLAYWGLIFAFCYGAIWLMRRF